MNIPCCPPGTPTSRKSFPSCATNEVVFTGLHPGTVSGQYEDVGFPVQNEPPLAFRGPERGLFDQRMLRVNASALAEDWRRSAGEAEAKARRENTEAVRSFIVSLFCLVDCMEVKFDKARVYK